MSSDVRISLFYFFTSEIWIEKYAGKSNNTDVTN